MAKQGSFGQAGFDVSVFDWPTKQALNGSLNV